MNKMNSWRKTSNHLHMSGNEKEVTKQEVCKVWEELIDKMNDYLLEVRKRGGTMGHKVGSLYSSKKETKRIFENL